MGSCSGKFSSAGRELTLPGKLAKTTGKMGLRLAEFWAKTGGCVCWVRCKKWRADRKGSSLTFVRKGAGEGIGGRKTEKKSYFAGPYEGGKPSSVAFLS